MTNDPVRRGVVSSHEKAVLRKRIARLKVIIFLLIAVIVVHAGFDFFVPKEVKTITVEAEPQVIHEKIVEKPIVYKYYYTIVKPEPSATPEPSPVEIDEGQ